MSISTRGSNRIEEIVVTNGGNGSRSSIKAETAKSERVGYARGIQKLPEELVERYLAKMDAYVDSLVDRTNQYVNKALEKAKKGPSEIELELGEPISPVFPPYPWWNLMVVGPFQGLGSPPEGPFLPNKIIQYSAYPAFLWTILWRNPAPIDWVFGNPSAAQVMNGRDFSLWAEMINLTNVSNGPDIHIAGSFSVGGFIDARLLFFHPPQPQQGKPDLYEVNVTLDVTEDSQPMAGFATWVYDLDVEPLFLTRPAIWPHWHYERPMRFLVYNP
jgi:hypothetical protein